MASRKDNQDLKQQGALERIIEINWVERNGEVPQRKETAVPDEDTPEARQEKKRSKERQRRSDVSKGFDDLLRVLFAIDPKLKLDAETRAAGGIVAGNREFTLCVCIYLVRLYSLLTPADASVIVGKSRNSDASLLSRVELINIAVLTLERIHQENEERKVIITHLTRGLVAAEGGGAGVTEAKPEAGGGTVSSRAQDSHVSLYYFE